MLLVHYMCYVLVYMLFFWSVIQTPQHPVIGGVFSACHTHVSHFHPSFPTSSERSMEFACPTCCTKAGFNSDITIFVSL